MCLVSFGKEKLSINPFLQVVLALLSRLPRYSKRKLDVYGTSYTASIDIKYDIYEICLTRHLITVFG